MDYADRRATQSETSRSQVVARALAELREREQDELAREGYAFYAHESEEFAASSLKAVAEVIHRGG